jgi:CheY-like chemotaxis protein
MPAACDSYSLLITDDDRTTRETLREILEPSGYRTILAGSGEEAVEIASNNEVHLALMDMHLPRISGLEALSLVRQFKARLPSILLTADRDEELYRRALSAQVYCVLAKPVSRDLVIHVVSRALAKFYSIERPIE